MQSQSMLQKGLLATGISLLSSCSAVDLKGPYYSDKADEKNAIQLYDRYLKQTPISVLNKKNVPIKGIDIWNSWLVRQFTVATEREQKFQLVTQNDSIEFRFLNGSRMNETVGIEGERSFIYKDGIKKYQKNSKILLYVKPLRDYILWPVDLRQKKYITMMPFAMINQKKYMVIFASDQPEFSDSVDQYLIYFNQQSNQIDYIQFTMRHLMKSYAGVLRYEYGPGILESVYVQDNIADNDFVHKIALEKY